MARRKFNVGDKVIGNEKKASFRGHRGTTVEYESSSIYWVLFNDDRKEYVHSWWLQKASLGNDG